MKRSCPPLGDIARVSLLAVVASTLAVACDPPSSPKRYPSFTPRTSAPPGAITQYVEDRPTEKRTIRLTEGVAMAFECRDTNGAPCLLTGSSIASESVASYRAAYGDLDQTIATGGRTGTRTAYLNRALFVVVAKAAGNTTLLVNTGEATVPIDVQVFAVTSDERTSAPPPAPSPSSR